MFLSRGDRDLGVAFQTHPGRQAFISSGGKEPRSALESRRVSLGAHWVDSDRKSTRLNSSHHSISYAVFCLKKKKTDKRSLNPERSSKRPPGTRERGTQL